MPAVSGPGFSLQIRSDTLKSREWKNTVGNSGMTPPAFAFLVPIFVIVVLCPFLCVFCIRKRRRDAPVAAGPRSKLKKPALERADAWERLSGVTKKADTVYAREKEDGAEDAIDGAKNATESEKECAICLSALYGPSPPEPAKLIPEHLGIPSTPSESPTPPVPTPTAPTVPPINIPRSTTPDPELILTLTACTHTFHAECLISWFMLRKYSCPICRAVYYTKEAELLHDEEAGIALPRTSGATGRQESGAQAATTAPVISNWRYFWGGERVVRAGYGATEASAGRRWRVFGRRGA